MSTTPSSSPWTSAFLHRMTNLLGIIPSDIAVLKRNQHLPKKEQLLLEDISRSVQEALQLLQSVFSDPGASSPAPISINESVREFLRASGDKWKGVKLQTKLAPDLPKVLANAPRLVEVMTILAENAARAAKSNSSPLVSITTRREGQKVILDINDNGLGVPTAIRGHLFSRPVTSPWASGLGIGLLIARQIMLELGGEIKIQRSDHTGTTMRLSMPGLHGLFGDQAEEAQDPKPLRLHISKFFGDKEPHPRSDGRALVVDDSAKWRRNISNLLRERGFDIDEVGTVAGAQRLIKRRRYDISFVDLRLDGDDNDHDFDGLKLISALREANPQALLVLLSGHIGKEILRGAFRLGVDDILSKRDFSPESTLRLLDNLTAETEKKKEAWLQAEWRKYIYELLATFSHELREPLVTIRRNAEALKLGALGLLTSAQLKAVHSIEESAQREFDLINAHLDLNRIERGAARLNYQECDLVGFVREEVEVHRGEAERRLVRLQTDLPATSYNVRLDTSRFRTALNPLVENAIKFSKEGGKVLIIVRLGDGYVEVSIQDQGPGMRSEEIDALLVWSPEVRRELSSRMRSSGLGLSMAKRIIELHDGRLWIASDGVNGTTVHFRLPVKN